MSLYSTAVKKPITTALCFVAVVVIGLFSLTRLSIDLLPNIETNTIMVLTSYPGASASDIETNVTQDHGKHAQYCERPQRHIFAIERKSFDRYT